MTVSAAGLAFCARFEGYRRYVYDDGAGWATIGIGHLLGPWSKRNVYRARYPFGWSYKRALQQLRTDAARADAAVDDYCRRDLNQHEHDALVDFTFNVGVGGLAHSTLLVEVNRKASPEIITACFERWSHVGTTVIPGLLTRRKDDARLYVSGTYQ